MFKFTVVIAALAVSAALAINVPEPQQQQQQLYQQLRPQPQRQQQQQVRQDPMVAATSIKHKPEKVVYVTEVKDDSHGDLLLDALSKLVAVPKKALGAVAALIGGKLKSLSTKGLIKAALLAGLVAVAAVAVISGAGLVSVVTGVFASAVNFKDYLGGGGGDGAEDYEGRNAAELAHIDQVAEFVIGAFDKYGEKQ